MMNKRFFRNLFGSFLALVLLATSARADLFVNELIGFGSGGDATPSVTFASSAVDPTNGSTYTFTSKAVNSAAGDKIVIGADGNGGTTGTVSSVKVHAPDIATDPTGTSLTSVIAATSGESTASLWQATMAAAITTADVVVVFSNTKSSAGIAIFDVKNAAAAASDIGSSTANPATDTIDCPANGVVIAIAAHLAGAARTYLWTNLTERSDETEQADAAHSSASDAFATTQTLAVTATPSGTTVTDAMVIASWAPAS